MVELDISKVFNRIWHTSLLQNFKSYGTSGQVFCRTSSFLRNRQLRVALDKSCEYPANACVLASPIFPTVHNGLPDDIIHNIAICADDTTLYFMFDQASEKPC